LRHLALFLAPHVEAEHALEHVLGAHGEELEVIRLEQMPMRGDQFIHLLARGLVPLLHKRLAAAMAGEALLKSASEDLLAASRTAKGGSK
jgi:hypothetical protein